MKLAIKKEQYTRLFCHPYRGLNLYKRKRKYWRPEFRGTMFSENPLSFASNYRLLTMESKEMKETIIKHKHIITTPSGRHKVVMSGHHFGTFELDEALRV